MQVVNCQVAIGGDLNNKGVLQGITPAEVQVLRMIHGPGSISDVEIVNKMHPREYSHEDVYAQLKMKYPMYEERVQEFWRDNGARFPVDVRELELPESAYRMPVDMMIERLAKPDDEAEEPIVKRGRKPKAKPQLEVEDLEFPDPEE